MASFVIGPLGHLIIDPDTDQFWTSSDGETLVFLFHQEAEVAKKIGQATLANLDYYTARAHVREVTFGPDWYEDWEAASDEQLRELSTADAEKCQCVWL